MALLDSTSTPCRPTFFPSFPRHSWITLYFAGFSPDPAACVLNRSTRPRRFLFSLALPMVSNSEKAVGVGW
jgi:hypothetical protein